MKKAILISVVTLLATSAFASSQYEDSLKKISAAVSDRSVIAAIKGQAIEKVEIGGDDNLDVTIKSASCQTIVGLTYVMKGDSIVGYKVENLANCQ